MSTAKQKWAQERNWSKAQLRAAKYQCTAMRRKSSTVETEAKLLTEAIKLFDLMLGDFKLIESFSRRKFLDTIKERSI